jgi:hypothetical protein
VSPPRSFAQALGAGLMRATERLLPPRRRVWAEAMRREYEHLERREAMTWAAGCFLVGLKERIAMIKGNLKISRWLLAPEMMLCFLPLTLLWLDGIDGASGLLRLSRATLEKNFIGAPGGTLFLVTMLAGVLFATIGPVGIITAVRAILWRQPVNHPWLRRALVAAPLLYGVVALAARAAELGVGGLLDFNVSDAFDFWSGMFLLSVLPALGAAHLIHQRAGEGAGALQPD